MTRPLNILWPWYHTLNLHGDRGNLMALVRICELYGIDTQIHRIPSILEPLDLSNIDIVVLNAGEITVLPVIEQSLSLTHPSFAQWCLDGGVVLATGTSAAILGHEVRRLDGTVIAGVGLLDMVAHERTPILGDDLMWKMAKPALDVASQPYDMTGSQIQMVDITLGTDQQPLGTVTYGYGNNNSGVEGAVANNVIFTNTLGPVLVKNPWFALEIINRALASQGADILEFNPALFTVELNSAKAIAQFNQKKRKPPWAQP
ncbi:MAG: hypothetical protein FWG15_06845 [Propionibacteriaceae bacterium]|nr:hypothetical protein [Propionibacteriaceae bacterium]